MTSTVEKGHVIKRYDNIVKSAEDKRVYRGLELNNRLKVLLASDPTTDKSAAAMDVNIGFLTDPDNLPGIAHFCEHMLFMGTKKYPEENTYNKFLTEYGGHSNAATATDHTYYYFDVMPDHLSSTLDIFAEFFLSPLFNVDRVDRELLAIHSEHDKNICNDFWRLDQLNRLISDPNHPNSKFGTGNKETLEQIPKQMGINIHEELLKFHKTWYSSNIMSLAVFGKESLDELEKIVVDKFSSIVDCNAAVQSWGSPYLKEHLGIKINVVPIKDIRCLHIDFPIPDWRMHYKSGPIHYISHLLGHEGPGSVLSLLKAKGWCNSLSCGAPSSGRGFAVLDISVDLTEDGMNHTNDIIELIFQYINLLKKEGIQRWIFDEIKMISSTSFRFKDKEEPGNFVTGHVHSVQEYPMEDILSAHYLLEEWKPEMIEELLNMLQPENIRMAIIARKLEPECNQVEKWYGTKYSMERLSDDVINKWKNCGLCSELSLPPPNSFLPDSFDLIPPDSESKDFPTIIKDTQVMRVWYKQDNEYMLPKLNCFFEFVSPLAYMDPSSTCLNGIFMMLYQDELNEYAYAAELAGINYFIRNTRNGLSLRFDGFNSKQHILLERFIEKLVTFKVNPERFEIFKEIYLRDLRNFEMQQPYQHCTFYMSMLLADSAWSKMEFLDACQVVTVEMLQQYIANFLKRIHVECFIHGNASKKNSLDLIEIIENKLPKNIIPLLPQQLLLNREIQLDKGSHYRIEVDHTVHSNSCTLLYYQCGLQSTVTNVLLELLLQIISEPCFNVLRTKEQLGYIVFSGIRRKNGVQGLRIIVQSEKHPIYVESRIEAFLNHMKTYLKNQSDEEFEKHRQALIAQMMKKPKLLLGLSFIYKSEIVSQQYHFDRVTVEVNALKQVTKDQLIEFYNEVVDISSADRQKLGIHVVSSTEGGAGNSNCSEKLLNKGDDLPDVEYLPNVEDTSIVMRIDDIVSFKAGRSLFPLKPPYINIPRKGTHCKL